MESSRKKLCHIFNLLIAVAFAMAFLFPACIFLLPVAIAAPIIFTTLSVVNSKFLFSLRTVCKIE